MKAILSRVHINKKQVAGLLIFMLLATVAEMMLPTLLAKMIDTGIGATNRAAIVTLAIIMAVMAILACLANVITTVLSAKISTKFAADLRREVFYKVQSFSVVDMDKFGTASLVTRSTSDITMVQTFMNMLLKIGITAPLMAIAGLVLSSTTGGKVSSVLTVAIPLLIVAAGIIIIFVSKYSEALRKKIDQINRLFLEALEGVRVIRAFNKQGYEMERFDKTNEDLAKTTIASNRVSGLLAPSIQMIFGMTTVGVMALGIFYIGRGEMEVGALVANTQYIGMILASIMMLSMVIMMFPMAFACGKRIAEVFNTEHEIRDGKKTVSDKKSSATVQFEHVTFSYPDAEEPVLQDISFESHTGEITAIIGSTGCGKSSILKLIPRLYDSTVGHIFVDGIDVKKYKLHDLRDLIGYVPQKNVLFSGDISTNLNFGKEEGTRADWEKAAEIACAKEFIDKKEDSYHSEIAQGGTNLSGGQRQRMAIARAMAYNSEIMILDEATSNVDTHTEQQIQQAMTRLMKGRTSFVIAHRLSTIKDADMILYMENGDIEEVGSHDSLMAQHGKYEALYNSQFA